MKSYASLFKPSIFLLLPKEIWLYIFEFISSDAKDTYMQVFTIPSEKKKRKWFISMNKSIPMTKEKILCDKRYLDLEVNANRKKKRKDRKKKNKCNGKKRKKLIDRKMEYLKDNYERETVDIQNFVFNDCDDSDCDYSWNYDYTSCELDYDSDEGDYSFGIIILDT